MVLHRPLALHTECTSVCSLPPVPPDESVPLSMGAQGGSCSEPSPFAVLQKHRQAGTMQTPLLML